jgi:hypothetical protein
MLSSEWESCPNCPPPCGAVPKVICFLLIREFFSLYTASLLLARCASREMIPNIIDKLTRAKGTCFMRGI